MRWLKFILLGSVVGIAACSGGPPQTPAVIAREAVAASAAAYSVAWTGFRTYAALPRCKPAVPPCKEPAIVVDLGQKLVIARDAVDRARDVANLIPDSTAPTPAQQAVIDAAAQAVGSATTAVKGAGR